MTQRTFANRTFAHLAVGVASGATTIQFMPGEINYILPYFSSGTWLYLTICDRSGNFEYVKVTGIEGDTLTVERGQTGSTARAWYAGSLVMSRPVAQTFENSLQRGIYRSGAYNPNGVLAGLYIGEKFYQTGPAAGQRRWWMYTNDNGLFGTGDRWRLIAGTTYTGESEDDDGFIYYIPVWTNVSDPTFWEPGSNFDWDPVNQWWESNAVEELIPTGTWHVGKRWTDMYIEVLEGFFSLSFIIYDSNDDILDVNNYGFPSVVAEEIRTLTWGAFDFAKIYSDNRAGASKFRIYVNDGAPYDSDWVTHDVTDNTHWTPTAGSWNGASWDMVWNGSMYELKLDVLGGWPAGQIYNRIQITFVVPDPGVDYLSEVRFFDVGSETIGMEGGGDFTVNPRLGSFFAQGDIDSLTIRGNFHGVNPGGTWRITKIELLTESIYL